MKIHLQDPRTNAFFVGAGLWTEDPQAATCFKSTLDALETTNKNNLEYVQILLHFDARNMDLAIPLRSAGAME